VLLLARSSSCVLGLEVAAASFTYELVCHVAACVWVSMFAIWKLVFVKFFVYLFSSRAAAVCGDAQHINNERCSHHACRALIHDRSQCPTPLRAGLRYLGPRVVSPHSQGLQGSHLRKERKKTDKPKRGMGEEDSPHLHEQEILEGRSGAQVGLSCS